MSDFAKHFKAGKPFCFVRNKTTAGQETVPFKSAVALVRHKGPKPFIATAQKRLGGRVLSVTVECFGVKQKGRDRSRKTFTWSYAWNDARNKQWAER
jgi:hypothetical protein